MPIPIADPYTVPAGHRIGVKMRLTFVGTSAHTLFYDSTRYPSGVSFQTGQVITHEDCPHLIGGPAPVSGGGSSGNQTQTPPPTDPPTTAPPPALLPGLPALPGHARGRARRARGRAAGAERSWRRCTRSARKARNSGPRSGRSSASSMLARRKSSFLPMS